MMSCICPSCLWWFRWNATRVVICAVILCAGLFWPPSAWTQTPGTLVTAAGGGSIFPGDGGSATEATLGRPVGVLVDGVGNLYFSDIDNHLIRKVTPAGIITTIAGGGSPIFPSVGDGGPATLARLQAPYGITLDAVGNLYIADTVNHRIRKVDTNGIITTVAGTGEPGALGGFSGDGGQATAARLNEPTSVIVDATGVLYIADSQNHRIRKVDTNGIITTIAGSGGSGFSGDGGPATLTTLWVPTGIAMDNVGNLYIADTSNHRIRKVDINGIITTVAGDGFMWFNGNGRFAGDGGPATTASLNWPRAVVVDETGNLYIAESLNQRVRKVDTNGIISTYAGSGPDNPPFGVSGGFGGDNGQATAAQLNSPYGVFIDGTGNLFVADLDNHRIRKVIGIADLTPTFTEVGAIAGVGDTGNGAGVAWGDYDNDGDLDLYLTNNGANRLYKNDGDSTFTEIGVSAGVADDGSGHGTAWGDYDNDSDLDLYVVNFNGTNRLYRNEGNGTFTEVSALAGVNDTGKGRAMAWADYDNDNDLDLYIVVTNLLVCCLP